MGAGIGMIEIPEGAQYVVQGSGRVDVRLLPDQVVEFNGLEVTGAMVFRKIGRFWGVIVVGPRGHWETYSVGEQDVPDSVKDLL